MQSQKRKKAMSQFIGVLFEIMIIMALICMFVMLWRPFMRKQNLDYMAKEMVRVVETEGRIGTEVNDLQSQLRHEFGINPTAAWNAEYIPGTNKIQIRSRFTLTLTDTVQIKLFEPSFGNPVMLNIPIKKKLTGVSQVYWK